MISGRKDSFSSHSGKNGDRSKQLRDIFYRCFLLVLAVLVCACLIQLSQQEKTIRSLGVRFDKANDTLTSLGLKLDAGRDGTSSTDLLHASSGISSYLIKGGHGTRVKRASGTEKSEGKGGKIGKKRPKSPNKRAIGQSYVLQNTTGPGCTVENKRISPHTTKDKLMCWKEDGKSVQWATSAAGNVQIKKCGRYFLTLQLSLMLKPQTCFPRRGPLPSVGYAVYLRKKDRELETKIMRCITGTTCNHENIMTCTSNRLVEMEQGDDVLVKVEGLLAHRTQVRVEPYFTSLSLVRVSR